MIHSNAVEKSFGSFSAVNKIDLNIKKGECFGLLGPNGAGNILAVQSIILCILAYYKIRKKLIN